MTLKTAMRVYRCGDRTRDGTEECDDGNTVNGDGCDEICRVEL
jgi:cysteine-rich repeat protein